MKETNFEYNCSRFFTNWLDKNKCNILISSFSTNHVITVSTNQEMGPFIYHTYMPRAMGIYYKDNKLTDSFTIIYL